ncbi:MAG: NnrS family protein [Rhizobiaceae bacterium]
MSSADLRPTTDCSMLRHLRAAGDTTRDGRGRIASMPPILHYGFRPFFFLAALHAGLAVPAWLAVYHSGLVLPGPFQGMAWHAHEMLFGYLAAVMAGFILTAVPNWTGRLPLSGWPLAGLVALWIAGRLATAFVGNAYLAMAADLAFPVVLAAAIWREVISGGNWRNAPVAAILTLFGLANALHHAEALGLVADGLGTRLALGVIAMLIALIGGRIVPSFTRNWLVKQGAVRLPASFGPPDKAALAVTAAALALWIALPGSMGAGYALLISGTLLTIRLLRWQGAATWREPIVFILHAGYGWLALSVLMLGAAALWPAVPSSAALHALTAGAVGTMTLAVMTRASLGHTGREIRADGWTQTVYAAVTAGAMLRVAAPFTAEMYLPMLITGGALWSTAFVLFAVRYAPVLFGRRIQS